MKFHKGRLVDHIHLRVRDIEATERFYEAVLHVLDYTLIIGEGFLNCDELWITPGDDFTSRIHLAFQAPDRDAVDRFYEAGLDAGGTDNGVPGELDYHPGYYAAYLLDPDGNNIEAVYHGPANRSADSVVITAGSE